VETQKAFPEAQPVLPYVSPREQAAQLLAVARRTGDRRQEASALTDLGILHQREGDTQRAVTLLEEALAIVRQLGDRSREAT